MIYDRFLVLMNDLQDGLFHRLLPATQKEEIDGCDPIKRDWLWSADSFFDPENRVIIMVVVSRVQTRPDRSGTNSISERRFIRRQLRIHVHGHEFRRVTRKFSLTRNSSSSIICIWNWIESSMIWYDLSKTGGIICYASKRIENSFPQKTVDESTTLGLFWKWNPFHSIQRGGYGSINASAIDPFETCLISLQRRS